MKWHSPLLKYFVRSSTIPGAAKAQDHLPHLNHSIHLAPPATWSRWLIWSLGSGSVAIFLWACVTNVDETIVLTGRLATEQGRLSIRSPSEGFVSSCPVKRHQRVQKDSLICALINDDLLSQESSESIRISLLQQQDRSIDTTLLLRQAQLQERIKLETDLLSRMKKLQTAGAIQEFQVLEKQVSLADAINQKQTFDEEIRRNKINVALQLNEAKASLQRLAANRQRFQVKAPANGYIQNVVTKSVGERIQAGEVLAEMIPLDTLGAELSAPSRLNSSLSVGDVAAISVDAFPSQDYGTLSASIRSISPTSDTERTDRSTGPVFILLLSIPNEQAVHSIPLGRLQSGMGVTARFSTRSRPMITYVFDFLDQFIAPLGEKR